jgi:hypothetical protein
MHGGTQLSLFGIDVSVTNHLATGKAVLTDTNSVAVARDLDASVFLMDQTYAACWTQPLASGDPLRHGSASACRDRRADSSRIVATPTSADLASFVGSAVNDDQATAVLSVIVALASSYTRGGGFTAGEPNDDVRAVILSASVRLLRDPSQIVAGETMGPFAITYRAGFDGWSVAELGVLNRYRVRAQ